MDPNQNQQVTPEIHQTQQLPTEPTPHGFKWSWIVFIIIGIIIMLGVGVGGYFLVVKRNQPIIPVAVPTQTPTKFIDFTDSAKVFTLKIPQNYGANDLSSYVTDSCTLFSDKSIVNPGITATAEAALQKEGTFIEVCYTSNALPDGMPNKLATPEDNFTILSSVPISTNGYSGFKAKVSAENKAVQDLVVLKSPYSGYATISKQTNGQAIFDNVISSFHFIAQSAMKFSTADQTVIRKMFSDQYNKDITVTFGYPSSNQNSVGGWVYLPQGQKCFNADRTASGWEISYVSTEITDAKCYSFSPPTN